MSDMNERSFTEVSPGKRDIGDEILSSAVITFAQSGFHGASMRQIASHAGVSLSNVYNYFAAKSDILHGILYRANIEQMAQTLTAVDGAGPGVTDRFTAAIRAFVVYNVEHREAAFVASSELRYLEGEQRTEIVALRDRQQSTFVDLIDEGVRTGAFRTQFPEEATLAILTMCGGIAVWYRPEGPLTGEQVADRYARFALAAVEGL
jgi:AcrR family transcriptional regulator